MSWSRHGLRRPHAPLPWLCGFDSFSGRYGEAVSYLLQLVVLREDHRLARLGHRLLLRLRRARDLVDRIGQRVHVARREACGHNGSGEGVETRDHTRREIIARSHARGRERQRQRTAEALTKCGVMRRGAAADSGPGALGSCTRQGLFASVRRTVARLAINDDLRHAIGAGGDARLLHCESLQQHVRQSLLQTSRCVQ